jgi:hypothetical protein
MTTLKLKTSRLGAPRREIVQTWLYTRDIYTLVNDVTFHMFHIPHHRISLPSFKLRDSCVEWVAQQC